nr:MAG TPA: Terminase small subunit [Caudoviricetes sp.]
MLTEKQKRFVEEYLIDMNGARAARAAGYSESAARETASRLLKTPEVAQAIRKARESLSERTEITQDWVLQRWAAIADVDKRAFFDDAGRLRPVSEWTREMALAVDGLDVTETDGEIAVKISKLKLSSSKAALDSIARHLGMFKDKVEVSVDETLAERIARAKARLK